MSANEPKTIIPNEMTKVSFAAATAYGEKIIKKKKRIQLTRAHTGEMATIDNGWIVIDRKWYAKV